MSYAMTSTTKEHVLCDHCLIRAPQPFTSYQYCQIILIFKEKFPSVINLILKYLAKIWSQNKLLWGSESIYLSPWTQGVMLYYFLYHGTLMCAINRCISTYKEKQITFPRKQEGKMIEGNTTPVFTGRVLFWMALLFWLAYLIVIIVLGSVPSSI